MGQITILNDQGDVKLEWDPKDKESTAKAKAEFDRLREDGFELYEVVESKGKPVTRFNKNAGRLLAAPGAKTKADKVTGARPRAMSGGPVAVRARL